MTFPPVRPTTTCGKLLMIYILTPGGVFLNAEGMVFENKTLNLQR